MLLETFDLNLLKALDVLLQEQNVTVAARKCHVTQSTMSGILRRLREQFDDPLLIQVGRSMKLSPRGEQLRAPVSAALNVVRTQVMAPERVAPAEAQRRFVIESSDYVTHILLTDLIRDLYVEAPGLTFDVIRPSRSARLRVERGELDLALLPRSSALADHPSRLLCEDSFSVIGCARNPEFTEDLKLEPFLALPHIGVRIETDIYPMAETWMRSTFGSRRRVHIYTSGYLDLPGMVMGTPCLAVVHERLARRFAARFPVRVAPVPFDLPKAVQVVQWSRDSANDETLLWLVDRIVAQGRDANLLSIARNDGSQVNAASC